MGKVKEVKSRRKFDDDLKTEILRMIHSGKNVKEISETFDIAENVLYRWKTDQNMKTKTKASDDQSNFTLKLIAENELLKKDNNRLQTERDFKKSVDSLHHVQLRDVYEFIKIHSSQHKISTLCEVMKVSRTAFYRYARGDSYDSDKKYLRAKHEIRKEFLVNKKRYGSRRIKVAISENGIDISRKTVAKLMK